MIDEIYGDEKCQPILRQTIEENGISVEIGDSLLLEGGDLNHERIAILKPDEYYHNTRMQNPPRSTDSVVATQIDGNARIYVIELRSSPLPDIDKKVITQKFDTIFKRFFTDDFSHIFHEPDCAISSVDAWLVCDPLGIRRKAKSQEDFLENAKKSIKRLRGMLSEYSAGFRPYVYCSKPVLLKVMVTPPRIEAAGSVDALEGV